MMSLLNILTLPLKIIVNIIMFYNHCFLNFIRELHRNIQKCINGSSVQYVALQTPESLEN